MSVKPRKAARVREVEPKRAPAGPSPVGKVLRRLWREVLEIL
jgi:hypothetical protein